MAVKKSFLKGYKPSAKIFGGVVVATTVIVGGYFGFRYFYQPPKPTPVQSVSQEQAKKETPKKVDYNGVYTGTSDVAQGISLAEVTISGTTLTGKATYLGPLNSKIPLSIVGTFNESQRKIEGTFSGSGAAVGQKVSVSGNYSGNIINTSMSVSYSATATATGVGLSQAYPGQITLSKK